MRALADFPTEADRVVGPGAILAGMHQQLLGDAAHVDAGAAPEALLRDGDLGPMPGGDAGAPHAPGTATDDEQVEVERHVLVPRQVPIPPIATYLTSRNSSIPYLEPSRPRPEAFIPPNGATAVETMPSLTPTMPYSRASLTRKMRPTSRA